MDELVKLSWRRRVFEEVGRTALPVAARVGTMILPHGQHEPSPNYANNNLLLGRLAVARHLDRHHAHFQIRRFPHSMAHALSPKMAYNRVGTGTYRDNNVKDLELIDVVFR